MSLKDIRRARKENASIFYKLAIDKALQKAEMERKKVLLYFTAKWCEPCNWMSLYVFTDSAVIENSRMILFL